MTSWDELGPRDRHQGSHAHRAAKLAAEGEMSSEGHVRALSLGMVPPVVCALPAGSSSPRGTRSLTVGACRLPGFVPTRPATRLPGREQLRFCHPTSPQPPSLSATPGAVETQPSCFLVLASRGASAVRCGAFDLPMERFRAVTSGRWEAWYLGRLQPQTRSVERVLACTKAEGGDSNCRGACPPNGFRDRRIRPLCHPSAAGS